MSQEYTLNFYEALKVLENNEGWIQGEQFADGVVVLLEPYLVTCNFLKRGEKNNCLLTRGMIKQKYRVVHTQPDAERRV